MHVETTMSAAYYVVSTAIEYTRLHKIIKKWDKSRKKKWEDHTPLGFRAYSAKHGLSYSGTFLWNSSRCTHSKVPGITAKLHVPIPFFIH